MLEQPEFLNHRATPHHLLMKTLFLVALATGNRVSEIAAFTRVGSKILPGSRKAIIAVRPGFLYRNQTMDRSPPQHCHQGTVGPELNPYRLCPLDSLRWWLALSDPWGVDAFFANPKSHKRWIEALSHNSSSPPSINHNRGSWLRHRTCGKRVPLSPRLGEFPLSRLSKLCSGNPPAYF